MKKWGWFCAACALYVLTVVFLYVVQYKIYGNVIRTLLIYVALFPVLAWLGWLLGGGYPRTDETEEILNASGIYREPPQKDCKRKKIRQSHPLADFIMRWKSNELPMRSKIFFAVDAVILVAATLFMICALVADPWNLVIYFYFGILAGIGVLCMASPAVMRKLSVMACVLFGELILITAVYLLIVSPLTVEGGRQLLAQEGYERIYYEKDADSEKTLELFYDGELKLLSPGTPGLGFYMYRCEKDGVEYGAAVSVTDKNIVAAEPLDNESGLGFFMDFD